VSRGPAPKSAALRRLQGNASKKRKAKARAQEGSVDLPPADMPKAGDDVAAAFDRPPSELKGDKEACAEWSRVVPSLRRRRSIIRLDRAALIAYCRTYSSWMKAEADLRQRGATMTTRTGYIASTPYFNIAATLKDSLLKFWTQFGMTTAARAKIREEAPRPMDEPIDDAIADEDDQRFEGLFLAKGAKRTS
jgi:P27 family predicted phage terminase small subunit